MKKKNPRKFKWTKAYRAAMDKDLVVDSTLDFEQRRNRPFKYDFWPHILDIIFFTII